MKKRWFVKGVTGLLVAGMVVSMAACGSAHKTASMDMMAVQNNGGEAYYDNAMEYDYAASDMEMPEAASDGGIFDDFTNKGTAEDISQTAASNQKLIRTVSMDVETKEFDSLMSAIQDKTGELGGYIENMDSYNGSRYSGNHNVRNATLQVRIPQNKLELFLSTVSDEANVVRRSENVTNVTLNYLDTQSHKESLQIEQERLLVLLERAEILEDIITLENRLADVRYEIESMEKKLRSFDNQVEYSTVNLTVREVQELTVVVEEEETTWQRISRGFRESLADIGNGFTEFFIWFVVTAPYLVIWGIVIVAVVLFIKWRIRCSRKKREKKAAQFAAQTASVQTIAKEEDK